MLIIARILTHYLDLQKEMGVANHFPEPLHRRIIRETYHTLRIEQTPVPDGNDLMTREELLHQLFEELEERLRDLQVEIQNIQLLETHIQEGETNSHNQ